ncbi:TetR/AcrR family transcriptional regulator [Pelagibius litoralis]|uniref:TetR/AcrR family transcriptional regulator n=1 Tax=Pelagibius litoralis TaxID=374515 RepID=A0A967EYT7_9PROT|nr:TetR/AcrR family transcriptional regulator [Pelagibius litoralis]NIA69864.1 TetR/AcrR family transcriptional regulator [Pelagibius litoralis]
MSKKRDTLIATADRLFYTEGFAATGIDRVVSVAGVALGTLYRHFDGKAGLVVGVLDYRETAFFARLDETAAGKEGRDRVLSLFDGLLSWAEQKPGNENGCLFLRAASEHPEEPAIRTRVLKHKKTYLTFCRKHLREGGWDAAAARRLAPRIFLLLEGAVATCGFLGNRIAIKQARDAAEDLLSQDPSTPAMQNRS